MGDFHVRILQLSGTVLAELRLPATAHVHDILRELVSDRDGAQRERRHMKRKLLYQGRVLEELDSLASLGQQELEFQLMLQAQHVQFCYGSASVETFNGLKECKRMHFAVWGPPLAGKTSLIQRCSENIFNVQYHTVIGIDFKKARVFVDHSPMEIFLWDAPAGKERFQVMQAAHLRGKVAVLLVIDLASDEPFWKMDHFINRIEEASIVTKLMLGNKLDLEAERKLSREDAERFAADRGFHYFETSAKDGSGIEEAFTFAILEVLECEERQRLLPPPVAPQRQPGKLCCIQ